MPKHNSASLTSKAVVTMTKKAKQTPKRTDEESLGSQGAVGGETEDEKYTFFYAKSSPFSQHHYSEFTVDCVDYVNAEQYMMRQKAVLFGDEAIASQILQESNPQAIKKLGRMVKGFDDQKWKDNRLNIVKKASYAKFSQNPDLKEKLLATEGTELVEASPKDTIWGIGLGANNPKAKTKSKWRGTNLLGKTLTEVRDQLKKERLGETTAQTKEPETD